VFGWLTERRRQKLLDQPFPPEWQTILDDNVPLLKRLDNAEQHERLRDLTVVFVAEKSWEGCGGLELTEEHQVTIAAQACILLLGREHELYEDVESILVYPTTMLSPDAPPSFFDGRAHVVHEGGTAILGQAHGRGGPVILAWDDVLAGARGLHNRNVVFHEFAHKIDMADGEVDGTPPLDTTAERRAWAKACESAFLELRERAEAGKPTFLDDYGATNEAEFFAVATEAYFLRPTKLRDVEPELHAVLADFYRFTL
jgi:Mlc titration factor MtfA (ptsG expression regulator)